MLKFIDDSEFDLLDSVHCDENGVYHWTYVDGDAKHSGFVKSDTTRIIKNENGEVTEINIYEKFVAKEAVNEITEITVTRKSQQEIDAEAKELQRKALQRQRNAALAALVHDFGDGRVMQVRPDDMPVIQAQIAIGTDRKWVMLDDTTAMLTVTELQTALASGQSQFQVIWDDYMAALEALNAS